MKKGGLLIFIFTFSFLYGAFPSYYYKIKNIKAQKIAFANILLPLIKNENSKILTTREKIIKIFKDPYLPLKPKQISFLTKLAKRYKIKNIFNKDEYLKKIDIIPPSIVLAQAAIESGWGKSRFVREANNIFGHWIYSNKGLKPKSKYEHIKIDYSIRIFPSLEDSLAAYMLNLNRNRAYKEFREKRKELRDKNETISGLKLVYTLKNYSQLKEEYVKRLEKVIKSNHWDKFDKSL